jgi:hypothetical protein
MRDDKVDAGLNATLDTRSIMFKILFAIFVPGLTLLGIKFITKLDGALVSCLAFMPKAL